MIHPNFLFIGPDKTGSSWLYEVLRNHPECYVPPCKDIYFFDRYYDRGIKWYLKFFQGAPEGTKAIGELSHDYLFSSDAAKRIASNLPGIKLITCLRQPAERTFSHYLYMVRSGRTNKSFEDALEQFPELINNSLYFKYLSEYFKKFERSQIKVLWFDDLRSDPGSFAKQVHEFLGLEFIPNMDYGVIIRPASHPRNLMLARLVKHGANIARSAGLVNLVGTLKRSHLANSLYKPYEDDDRPVMSSETQERLRNIFIKDILGLQRLLGVNLNHWL